jgi:hypothetical protein
MNEDDPSRRMQFRTRFQHEVNKGEERVSKIIWIQEAAFKLNGTVNRRNFVYWAAENPHIYADKAINLSGGESTCQAIVRVFSSEQIPVTLSAFQHNAVDSAFVLVQ